MKIDKNNIKDYWKNLQHPFFLQKKEFPHTSLHLWLGLTWQAGVLKERLKFKTSGSACFEWILINPK